MLDIYILKEDNRNTGLAVYSKEEVERFIKCGENRSYEKISVFNNYEVGEAFQEKLLDAEIKILSAPRSGTSAKSGIYKKRHGDNLTNDPYASKMCHMYLLSNEEICEGDWCYDIKINEEGELKVIIYKKRIGFQYMCTSTEKKIVAATDIKLNLPIVGIEFLNEYISDAKKAVKVKYKVVKVRGLKGLENIAVIYK